MTEDEKYVREMWQHGRFIESRKFGTRILAGGNMVLGASWSAAAEFTRTRLQQIRDVEEEIAWLMEQRCHPSEISTPQRILAREQAALADLKRGLRVAE